MTAPATLLKVIFTWENTYFGIIKIRFTLTFLIWDTFSFSDFPNLFVPIVRVHNAKFCSIIVSTEIKLT